MSLPLLVLFLVDIWDVRFHWDTMKSPFLASLINGTYRLSPMLQVGKRKTILWSSLDALALKWVELGIRDLLPLHPRCEHIKGHGGGVASAHRLTTVIQQGDYHWVCHTDIKGYCGTIDKSRLQAQLARYVKRPAYQSLLNQYLHYSVEFGGLFHTPQKGIPRGCSLSPLLGAFHLWVIDDVFAQLNLHYIRYMDDFIILTKTRHQLRKAVKLLNTFLADMGFTKHPDKTFIGRISRGFDWMGGWLTDKGITGMSLYHILCKFIITNNQSLDYQNGS